MPRVPNTVPSLRWDIFCQVVDNHGDLGVCWRLSSQLAALGHRVRLWVDDSSALRWMAPGAMQGEHSGVQVLPWDKPLAANDPNELATADVWIEAFGCEIPHEFLSRFSFSADAGMSNPVWINLEYLSAERYVERMHRLPSPVLHGPAAGHTKWFFYPGFTSRTGGLLREPDLAARQANFDRAAWLAAQGIAWHGEKLVSMFCYEPAALAPFLRYLAQGEQRTRLLVTPGRATAVVEAVLGELLNARMTGRDQRGLAQPAVESRPQSERGCGQDGETRWGQLSISYLPHVPQAGYDQLLWACDLNFVRGEDSLVRALWAAKPFVWQIYPQDDDAHHAKLEAFMDWMGAPESLREFHRYWNGVSTKTDAFTGLEGSPGQWLTCPAWGTCASEARQRLYAQNDLITQLTHFVAEKR